MSDSIMTFSASGGGASGTTYALPSKKIGLCHGVFDVLHFGHVAHLVAARKICDELIVVVTPKQYVNKGHGRPIFDDNERCRVLSALKCVDRVYVGEYGREGVAIRALQRYLPSIYIKGHEYADLKHEGFKAEVEYCRANGIQVVFTCEPTFSSTETIKRLQAVKL